jgi:quinol monooxygenase YgiN
MTDGFVVLVEFDVPAARVAEFVRLVGDNAAASVRDEPGCRRFDVLVPEGSNDPSRIVLYEIYRDADAFDAHLRTPHFRSFQDAAIPLVTGREVRRFELHENAKSV